jgi:hypothetical protein
MITKRNGKQYISVGVGAPEDRGLFAAGTWFFSRNGWQSIGVEISVEMFDMLQSLITTPGVVEYYESLRNRNRKCR